MRSLDEQVRALKAAGEPVEPAHLKTWPTLPDERNAAKIVWELRDRMRQPTPEGGQWAQKLTKQGMSDHRLPLAPEDAEEIRQALAPQQDVLKLLDRIANADGFDWGGPPPSPYAVERKEFPEGAYWGTCRHQLYLDGLLAIHQRDANRAWRRVEILRRLGEGMASYPGHHDLAPLWPYLRELSALLAADAVAWGVASPDERTAMEKLITYWLDERPVLDAVILHYQRERVAIIDAQQLISTGKLTQKDLARWGHDVNSFTERRIGLPMWPTVVKFYTGVIDTLRNAKAISRGDSTPKIIAYFQAHERGDFQSMFVASQLGPWVDGRNATHRRLRATQMLAATAIAVQLHRMDNNGALPAKLDDLVPKYLPAVPVDPNDEARLPLRYRADEAGGAILWTTGKDGTDEGGKECPAGTSRMDYRVKFDDVVRFQPVPR